MWSVLNVPTMWYFIFPRQRGMFLLFLQCGILTVLAVWYIICPRQYGMFLLSRQCGILTVPDNVECSYCSHSVVFQLSPTICNVLTVPTVWYFNCPRQCVMSTTMWNVITFPTVWYFNCPRQCWMFLLFLQCGILTVPDNVECSRCSYIVVF
jgi:DNA-directed RNA polymerase subunit RPC12/RpoP